MRNISSLHVSLMVVSSVDSCSVVVVPSPPSPPLLSPSFLLLSSASDPSGTGVTVNLAMVVLPLPLPPPRRGTAAPAETGTVGSSPRATVWAVYSSCWADWPPPAAAPYSAASECAAAAAEVGETAASAAGKAAVSYSSASSSWPSRAVDVVVEVVVEGDNGGSVAKYDGVGVW
ncbi:hypothetical protein TYRP_006588 [Tyrophagus putrescentiae]|nr:hypothetical protein TYRP_006588 [Tyrophagus putrescentiae]